MLFIFSVFTYGFTDANLILSGNPLYLRLHEPLFNLVHNTRPVAAGIFILFLLLLSGFYLLLLKKAERINVRNSKLLAGGIIISIILVLSFCALTYDLFNYITTAKVLYTYHENPYVVMPVEIPNEPYLAFTRAANKYALYGPVWLAITAIGYYLGGGHIWQTIIAFKALNALIWLIFSYLIYHITKSVKNVIFFALNPLVLIEVLVSGHNDLYMMILALGGLMLWQKSKTKSKFTGLILLISSFFIKGATLVLLPLIFIRKLQFERLLLIAYCLLLIVFFIVAPLREELYPWYAVWLVSTAALLPLAKHGFITGFTIVLSIALELRHIPYMWMGYYEGPGPMLRLLLTIIPVILYLLINGMRRYLNRSS